MAQLKRLGAAVLTLAVLISAASCKPQEPPGTININTIVIPSRNHTRMQPRIYYAFKDTAKRTTPFLEMKFVLFNPFQYQFVGSTKNIQKELLDLSYQCLDEVAALKKANPQTDGLLKYIHEYIESNPQSHLAKFHREIEQFMDRYQFLIIESSDTYGAHPMFYKPGITEINTPDGANEKDILEALYAFFFIDAAFKENKPVWGTCHGSQIGYIHAGGKLGRLFEYKEDGYDVEFKKSAPKYIKEETWRIGKMLYTQEKGSDYEKYGVTVYPVPEIYKRAKDKDKEMYINKDFQHSFALVEPIPKDIEVISYHPLSEYKDKASAKEYEEYNRHFENVLINQVIVDAYKYKSMLGTQYHPQYTYDDLETSIVFDYLARQLVERYK